MAPIVAAAWLAASQPATSQPTEVAPAEVAPSEVEPTEPPEGDAPNEPAPAEDVVATKPAPSAAKPPATAVEKPADAPATPTKPPDRYAAWEHRFRGYAELDTQLTQMDDAFTTIVGGGAGFIIKRRLILGASGYGVVYQDKRYHSIEGDRMLRTAWGGGTIGVYAVRRRRVETSANWLLAGGRACLNFTTSDAQCHESTGMVVNQVEIDVYVKIKKILRLGFGIGYRFVGATAWHGPGNWSLSGGYGSFKIALGRF